MEFIMFRYKELIPILPEFEAFCQQFSEKLQSLFARTGIKKHRLEYKLKF